MKNPDFCSKETECDDFFNIGDVAVCRACQFNIFENFSEEMTKVDKGKRKFTLEFIKEVKNVIKSTDNETAHCLEDCTYKLFIKYIINNCTDEDIKKMAIKMKEIVDLDYARWYA